MFFGDFKRQVYALDAATGKLLWKMTLETHPRAVLTGAPALYKGLLYVPISSWEETAGGVGSYGCCTARGGLAALDAKNGRLIWKTYAIEQEPHPTVKNSAGTQMYGPAGAAVWSAPTIDAKRAVVYIGTGDTYTDVKDDGSDAIMALDLASGKVKWKNQVTQNDSFLMGCNRRARPGRNSRPWGIADRCAAGQPNALSLITASAPGAIRSWCFMVIILMIFRNFAPRRRIRI
ncbi:MAG: PQQ-binding-like beta-propeller repeat protein [Steroidobacteraceae bacterium]